MLVVVANYLLELVAQHMYVVQPHVLAGLVLLEEKSETSAALRTVGVATMLGSSGEAVPGLCQLVQRAVVC